MGSRARDRPSSGPAEPGIWWAPTPCDADGLVKVGDELWTLAVDAVLIKVVDSDTAVHEEVLRLLLAGGRTIPLIPLANYLHLTLSNSRCGGRKGWDR